MKSIIYLLIAVFIFGIIAMGLTNKPATTHAIRLQATDSSISSATLSQAAEVISMRLKSFGQEKFDVKSFPDKQQILVTLANDRDLKVTGNLITQKGMLEFYETYDHISLIRLLKGDSTLFKLMHAKATQKTSAEIGCVPAAEMQGVKEWLRIARVDGKCRFAWNDLFNEPDACLYSLRTADENRIPLTGADIRSFEIKHDTTRHRDDILFSFKTPAIKVWADVTRRNLAKPIAIVMDNKVLYAPAVADVIEGGNCQISGDFTSAQVHYIVAIGTSGVLPADFTIVK